MTFIQSIVLGIIQGLTEFLPISSSAHLVILPYLLNWSLDPQKPSFSTFSSNLEHWSLSSHISGRIWSKSSLR